MVLLTHSGWFTRAGWIIGGLLMMGLGVIFTAIVASAVCGQWSIAGSLVLAAALIWGAQMFGLAVAGRQLEKDEDVERSAEVNNSVDPTPSG